MSAIPLQEAEAMLQWLRETHGIEVGGSGTLARDREPRWDLRSDFEPMRGLGGMLAKEVHARQHQDAIARHDVAAQGKRLAAKAAEHAGHPEATRLRNEVASHERTCIRLRSAARTGAHG